MAEVHLLYFAWVRERIGLPAEQVAIAAEMPMAALLDQLRARSDGHRSALSEPARLRAAVNQDFVGWDAIVRPGDEVAIFPPVTGG